MNEKPNEPTIEEIKEALAKITPGEWAVSRFVAGFGCPTITLRDHLDRPFGWSVHDEVCLGTYQKSIATIGKCRPWFAEGEGNANAAFIAGAPHYVRFLLARVEALESWIKAANQFAWVHDSFCPRRKANAACTCGLDGFLSRPRLFVDSYKQRVEALETALSDLMAWGVEQDNPGIGYITVQVDRAAVEQARVLLKGKP